MIICRFKNFQFLNINQYENTLRVLLLFDNLIKPKTQINCFMRFLFLTLSLGSMGWGGCGIPPPYGKPLRTVLGQFFNNLNLFIIVGLMQKKTLRSSKLRKFRT